MLAMPKTCKLNATYLVANNDGHTEQGKLFSKNACDIENYSLGTNP